MQASGPHRAGRTGAFDYLCVDAFLKTIVDARALGTAFELGLIDHLDQTRNRTFDDLTKRFECDRPGLQLLLDLLRANRVIEECAGEIRLTRHFRKALAYRDLLEAKLQFADFISPDFSDHFTTLVKSPDRFARRARVFDLFAYNRCLEYSPENYERTKRWVRITTALTRYEAQVCMQYHDFTGHRRMLDIGGNSGEFALRLCKKYVGLSATVLDLPLVCDIGLEHIRSEPEAGRIRFIKANALSDPLPRGFDLVAFKSMLHDWPQEDAKEFILKAGQSLEPGGTLLIFERGPLEIGETGLPYSMIPFLLFFRSFRSPSIYEDQIKRLGFRNIQIQRIDLEMPFFLVTGTKT
ncbi:MAG: methyltransferase [Thermodesulfobacteriota bacterium]